MIRPLIRNEKAIIWLYAYEGSGTPNYNSIPEKESMSMALRLGVVKAYILQRIEHSINIWKDSPFIGNITFTEVCLMSAVVPENGGFESPLVCDHGGNSIPTHGVGPKPM